MGVYYERIIDTKSHSAPGHVLHSAVAEAFRLKKRQKMSQSRRQECRNSETSKTWVVTTIIFCLLNICKCETAST